MAIPESPAPKADEAKSTASAPTQAGEGLVDAKDQERLQRGVDSKQAALKAGEEGTQVAMDVETATNKNVSQEERDEATKQASRGAGRLGVKAGGAVAGATTGTDVGAAGGAEIADTVNVKGAQLAKQTGVAQQMGYGDIEALSDVPADEVTKAGGKEFQEQGIKARDDIGEEGKLHEEAQFAGEGTKAGLQVAQNKTPDNVDKVADKGAKVAQKHDVIDEQTAKDVSTSGKVAQTGVDVSKGDLDEKKIKKVAETTKEVGDRAEEHEVIDKETNQNVQSGSDMAISGANMSEAAQNPSIEPMNSTPATMNQAPAEHSEPTAPAAELKDDDVTAKFAAKMSEEKDNENSVDMNALFPEKDEKHPPIRHQHAQHEKEHDKKQVAESGAKSEGPSPAAPERDDSKRMH